MVLSDGWTSPKRGTTGQGAGATPPRATVSTCAGHGRPDPGEHHAAQGTCAPSCVFTEKNHSTRPHYHRPQAGQGREHLRPMTGGHYHQRRDLARAHSKGGHQAGPGPGRRAASARFICEQIKIIYCEGKHESTQGDGSADFVKAEGTPPPGAHESTEGPNF